jgi:hypothetical protein
MKPVKQPINQYITWIDQDLSLAGVKDNTTKSHLLLLGLPKLVREKLKLGGAPKGYDNLKRRILDIEVTNYMYSGFKHSGPDTMQVDQLSMGIDQMVIQETTMDWVKTTKCYGCGETRHIITDCPNLQKKHQNLGKGKVRTGGGKFRGKPHSSFKKGKGKGKGKAQRIRALDAPSEDNKSDSSSNSEQDEDDNDDQCMLIIQEMAKNLPHRTHR